MQITRKEVLTKATNCVCGKREQDYGKPEDNFGVIADLWNAYFGKTIVSPHDVAMLMTLLKVARIKTGTATEDSYVDAAGYVACGAELHSLEKEKEAESTPKECDCSYNPKSMGKIGFCI